MVKARIAMFWKGEWIELVMASHADISSDGQRCILRKEFERRNLQDGDGHREVQPNEVAKAARMVDRGALSKAMEILNAITIAPTTWEMWALL